MVRMTTGWLYVIAGWVTLYFPAAWLLLVGTRRHRTRPDDGDPEAPSVSVVVSARNEAKDIRRCIASLAALDYPGDRLEIVLVNDFSTDETGTICDEAAAADPRIRVLHSAALPPNGLEAKARGIAHGIAAARHDWILITDADAVVPTQWARRMLSGLSDDVGIVGGPIVVARDRWWSAPERMSWAFLQLVAIGFAGWGLPFIVFGPNMGIRRSAYLDAGGLAASPVRIAEDLGLFLLATRRGWRTVLHYSAETAATVHPVPTAGHLFSQHRRWLGGGIEVGWQYAVPLFAALFWGLGIAAFLVAGWALSPFWWTVFLVAKLATDGLHLHWQAQRLALRDHVTLLGVLQLYKIVTLAYLPLSFVFDRRVRWRGAGYVVRYD
ncbi:MAG: glycosyltransferase [Gemmatimonadaceae bacterium]|nr:glycosyltransferase [Gemmatimonadaceae bacterium]